MKNKKARVKKGYLEIDIRSSMYDKQESLFMRRKMTKRKFMELIEWLLVNSES